ncbi:hypothetical protein AMTRI_Chr04g182850 [Amborella trichopoda]
MKLLVWNVRGLGQPSKKEVKDLTSKHSPAVLARIETKQPEPDLKLIHQVWGRRPSQWVSLAANGASEGIWIVWNPSDHILNSSHKGDFSVTILLTSTLDGLPWKFTAIYGPNSPILRNRLWSELELVASFPHPIWCLGGNFNVIRWSHEQNSSTSISQGMREFSDFISQNELLDIPLQGSRYTWSNHATNPTLSKLDRFLFSLNWEEHFPRSLAMALPKPISDHYPILLETLAVKRGHPSDLNSSDCKRSPYLTHPILVELLFFTRLK